MSALPPLYAGWMEEVLPGAVPSEGRATCDRCAMCARSDERPGNGAFFDPHVKCCSYLPVLHNILVGGILADRDPALSQGRASVEARLEARIEVTPLGLGRPALYNLLYAHAKEAFGTSRNLRCPHYIDEEGGRCGIWRHRNAVCTTWFCKHERGAIGLKFWQALERLLSRVEVELSRWCVLELDIGARALESLFPIDSDYQERPKLNAKQIDQVADLEAYRLRWGKWLGREREFYRECARLVDDLSWEDIARICGPEVLVFAKLLQEAYDRLTSSQVPEIVRLKPVQIMGMGQDWVQVSAYSGRDPLKLPRKLLEVLPYLQSQPIAEALQAIEREKGLRLSRDVVRKLIDFDILAAGSEAERLSFAEGRGDGEPGGWSRAATRSARPPGRTASG